LVIASDHKTTIPQGAPAGAPAEQKGVDVIEHAERSATASSNGEWSEVAMRARLVRYSDLRPCFNAFIDTRNPGSEAKENFTIIGPGVSENSNQFVHIPEPHGFNIGGARQPPNCVNSQHNHQTAEVFVIHSGHWTFNLGERGDDVRLPAGPGSVVSIPTGIFRGFTNVGDGEGFLWVVLGGDDPGRVQWAPYVFDMAKRYGLTLLEDGTLVDTAAGATLPDGAQTMKPTTAEEVSRLYVPTLDEAKGFAVTPEEFGSLPFGPLSGNGVEEQAVLGPANAKEGTAAGKLGWAHGFQLRRLMFQAGGATSAHVRCESEVLFVHEGDLEIRWPGGTLTMGAGDTITVPVGLERRYASTSGATVFAVHGGDSPEAPQPH
jgi:mannose-6-phosphate isomerase-like protein (cupin superfamily)